MNIDDLLVWILAILALLATSALAERVTGLRRVEKFTEAIYKFQVERDDKPSMDLLLSDRKSLPALEVRMHAAQDIAITGGSLFRLASEYLGYFEQKAQNGCRLRFLIVNPDSQAAELLAKHVVYEISDVETYRQQICASLSSLCRLRQRFPKLVEVRACNFVPPLSLFCLDPGKEHGVVYVELYTLAVPTRTRPIVVLRASQDPNWYKFFMNQLSLMWQESSVWNPEAQPALSQVAGIKHASS